MIRWVSCCVFAVLLCGCRESTSSTKKATEASAPAASLDERYWIASAPSNVMSVIEARAKAGSEDELAVVGRVSEYVATRAQFKLTDLSFAPCNAREGDSCETPWDYCCEPPDELAQGTVVVEIRDGDATAKAALAGFHGFDHLKEVIVAGRATKDDAGNVTLIARGMHVKP